MNETYARDLDLNLLRVFVVVADAGSVTAAAAQLYLTQPAVSAALKRLTSAVGEPLFTRQGRGLVLTARGERLLASARPHLGALVEAAFAPARFDPATSERVVRLGLSDASEAWLLPAMLRELRERAPRMRVVVLPVQFRTVGEALASGRVDLAVTVADELPAGVTREALFEGGFVCLFDPRHVRLGARPSRERYLAADHVIVSYNGDLRGIIEDFYGVSRRVRCSVSSFSVVGAVVDDTALVATVPDIVARSILAVRPHLAVAPVPFELSGTAVELLARAAVEDDPAVRFVRDVLARVARALTSSRAARGAAAEVRRQRRSR
ncbi:MAG: LysR family transcriptional regulator [Sandaracinaceae bacterium]|nr:LysR family transcriptional regulator [Sandaracinaceae bacterium]